MISIVFVGFMSLQPAEVVTPQTKEFLGEMLISVILIMAMTCSFLMAWIYRSILSPIETLKKATQNIRDGNLDFEVEIEDNDEIGELCADFEEMRLRLKESTEEKVSFDSSVEDNFTLYLLSAQDPESDFAKQRPKKGTTIWNIKMGDECDAINLPEEYKEF